MSDPPRGSRSSEPLAPRKGAAPQEGVQNDPKSPRDLKYPKKISNFCSGFGFRFSVPVGPRVPHLGSLSAPRRMGVRTKKRSKNVVLKHIFSVVCFTFLGEGAVRGLRGYENRVRGVFLHILAMGYLWGVISNLFLFDLGAFHFFCVFWGVGGFLNLGNLRSQGHGDH